MTEKTEIKQQTSHSDGSTQIGVQNNYQGLTATDAFQMACQMFRENYPKLKEDVIDELNQIVIEKLKNTPPQNIVSPSPRIAVPAIQNATLTEETPVRELYAELLAKSMNTTTKNGVHPGFVEIIKQLCSDEAKILRYLKTHSTIPTITIRYENDQEEGIDIIKKFSNIGFTCGCERPFYIGQYFDNLIRLGLVNDADAMSSLINKELYEPLKKHPYVLELLEKASNTPNYNKGKIKESYIELTDYGIAFCNSCIC